MSPSRLRWGIILILLGILFFFRNINVLDSDFWRNLILFVPVLLIAIGIEKIFTKTKLQFISYLTSAVILLGGLFFAFSGRLGENAGGFFSDSHLQRQYDDKVKKIMAEVDVDETALTIRDSGEDIIYASFDKFSRKPDVTYAVSGDTAQLKIASRGHDFLGGIVKVDNGDQEDWMVSFSNAIPLDFICKGDDADIHLNMATTPLENLVLDMQNSHIYLKLGDMLPEVHVKINGEDSNLKLRVPEHMGVKINAEGYESYFEHVGMHRDNGWYVTSGIDTLKSKVEINMNAHLNSFSIDYF